MTSGVYDQIAATDTDNKFPPDLRLAIALYTELQNAFAAKSVQTTVTSGRLSDASLIEQFGAQAVADQVDNPDGVLNPALVALVTALVPTLPSSGGRNVVAGTNPDVARPNISGSVNWIVFAPAFRPTYFDGSKGDTVQVAQAVLSAAVADNFNRADGAPGTTPTGGKAYTLWGGLTAIAVTSNQLAMTAGTTGNNAVWLVDPGELTNQRRLDVLANPAYSPGIILQSKPGSTALSDRLTLTRQTTPGSPSGYTWCVYRHVGGANSIILSTTIDMDSTMHDVIWEPFGGQWRIWIKGTYIGSVPMLSLAVGGSAFGGYRGSSATGSASAMRWDNLGDYAFEAA